MKLNSVNVLHTPARHVVAGETETDTAFSFYPISKPVDPKMFKSHKFIREKDNAS